MKLKGLLVCCLVVSWGLSFGQLKYIAKNLQNFDKRKYHFGFIVGGNNSNLTLKTDGQQAMLDNNITSIRVQKLPGLDLAIIASYNIHQNIRLRFTPGISFQDRKLLFSTFDEEGEPEIVEKTTESTNIELPLYFKFRTNRYGNFAAYALGGGKYLVDMTSRKKEDRNGFADDTRIFLEPKDFAAVFGAGVDFFLPYFKFGIELRYSKGFGNLLIKDGTPFTDPINTIQGQTFQFCLTFEG